jgi:GR25 family glycosyltransferase involved in LPS biosynthesis
MFSAGHPNSCIAVCEAMQVGGHDIVFLKKDNKVWWDDVLSMMGAYSIESIDEARDLDLIIEVAFHASPLQRASVAKKTVWYCRKPALFTDMESTVFACRAEGRNLEGVSEIWLADLYNSSDDSEFLKTLYPSVKISIVPWLWSPTIVEAHRKEKQSPVWPQVIEHVSSEMPWSLHIMETNSSNTSSCTLPLLMIKDTGITKIAVHNTEVLSKSRFFKENIVENACLPPGVHLVGRQRGIDWSHEPRSIIVSHSRFIPLKQANLEAAWVGIPLVHNNDALGELGCGLEDLYYNANSIGSASNAIKKVIGNKAKDNYMYDIDVLSELRKRILYKYSPEANASKWLALLNTEVEQIVEKKVYTVLFTDMWSDFNPEYNMFILALQNYLKDYQVRGTSVVNGKHNIHIFGPFGSDWLSIEGPKVHYTGENTGPIEHASVKLNIGYKNLTDKYLRVPLWMFEIDLFEANLEKIRNPLPLPLDRCTNVNLQTRPKFCAFVVSNPKNIVRNEAFHTLSKYKQVDSGGRLFNNVGSAIFAGLGGGGGELKKHEFLRDYKFCLCYENEQGDGYVTEKILHAKAAGCIPIYWGSSDVVKDFDPRGFIHITDPSELIAKVKEIDEDEEKWFEMASIPALTKEKVQSIQETFEQMSELIVKETDMLLVTSCTLNFVPSLERWLKNVEEHRKTMSSLKARVYLASDVPDSMVPKKDFVTYVRLPSETPVDFPDFWNPQHFAWKLWILNEVSTDPFLKGSTVFYMDCGSVIIRWPSIMVENAKAHNICFLEDASQQNSQWCHSDFCEALEVTEKELSANQVVAGLIMFRPGIKCVMEFFKEALRLGSIRKVIVGEKWSGVRNGKPFGHRHDQSILSILSERNHVGKVNIDLIYNHTSARATYYGGQHIYVHRGDYKSHVPLLEGIDDAYVINLDRRADRLKSFIEHHPYFRGKVRRHRAVDGRSLELSQGLCSLLKPNDFFWKKAVSGCALSHLKLWTMLRREPVEIQSYLIMEDDARLKPEWSSSWLKIQSRIPLDWECVYLGGVLPPNKDGFKHVLEQTEVPGLCRIAPNTFFGQTVPSRQFHFCAYAYVLSKRGVQRILDAIELHGGIWTSADHVLYNSLDKENVYILNPLEAYASQDDDPNYVNSDFNDFSRIDTFDSDLWNNDERFSKDELSRIEPVPLNINNTIDEIYSIPQREEPSIRYVTLDTCGIRHPYEKKWLEELMGKEITIEIVTKYTDLRAYKNLYLIVCRPNWNEQFEWMHGISQSKKTFKVIHLSDENLIDPCVFYNIPNLTGVLRFYPRNDLHCPEKVLTIPLGYHWSYNENMKPLTNRKYTWSFCGTDWNGRSEQMKQLLEVKPNKLEFFSEWNSPGQLKEKEYLDLLSDTAFVPCPAGNNVETFRFYEALERGCIPVFIELPSSLENSGIAFLKTKSWLDAANLICHLNKNPEQLLQYQMSLLEGWMKYKRQLKGQVAEWMKPV